MVLSLATGYEWTGRFFPTMGALKEWMIKDGRDVEHLEIRATPRGNGRLLIQKDNDPATVYVLIRMPHMWQGESKIIGWCYGTEGKCKKYWANLGRGKPCFAVPGSRLRPMKTLPKCGLAPDSPRLVRFLAQWDPDFYVVDTAWKKS